MFYVPEASVEFIHKNIANLIMAYLDVPLSSLADNVEFIKALIRQSPELSDIYINRWNLTMKIINTKINPSYNR